ncbi:hypothetical protein LXL04_036305 [Taraxacum kok-saghyz]
MELKSVMESERNQGSVLKAILQAKSSNSIQGICGRMGDLDAIDAKYDVAVSTACGGLDYIVVETTAAAQACVAMLRKNNLGVATFMILDFISWLHMVLVTGKVNYQDYTRKKSQSYVKNEGKTMGNTVVAKDIDQATRIAYGGNQEFRRVVTLDGALFEKSGTMSGGGNKPRGGKSEFTFIPFLTWIRDKPPRKFGIFNMQINADVDSKMKNVINFLILVVGLRRGSIGRKGSPDGGRASHKGKLKKRSRHHPPNNNFYLHVMMSHNSNHQNILNEVIAKEKMPKMVYDCYASGAEDQGTLGREQSLLEENRNDSEESYISSNDQNTLVAVIKCFVHFKNANKFNFESLLFYFRKMF